MKIYVMTNYITPFAEFIIQLPRGGILPLFNPFPPDMNFKKNQFYRDFYNFNGKIPLTL